jgi:glycosyltransferase involved in cell wall biosynthesis
VIPLGVGVTVSNSVAKSDPYVLVLSRLHPKKGLDVLIDALLSLVQKLEFAEWRLVIAGEGPSEYVSMLKAKAGADERITFTGWLDGEEKNAVLSGASLLVLPSHQENFGLCVMEALAQSVPVLVSPNVNLAPEIAAANAGWIASIEKTALEEKLAEALSNREELTKRGRAGLKLAEKYSWENCAHELVDLYRTVIQRSNNGSAYVQRV